MAWEKILDAADTQSRAINVSQPMALLVEGTFSTHTVTVEMKRIDAPEADPWHPVNLKGALVASDPLVALGGIPDTIYRVNVNPAGLNVYFNNAYPVQGA